MKFDYPIPPIMKELATDPRGYPIPYFVPIINGKPDFRYQDTKKRQACLDHSLCSICGKKLYQKSYWFIAGPMGFRNQVHSDAPMHEDCARFSINVCPHLVFMLAERRTSGSPNPSMLMAKPNHLFLCKADWYEAFKHQGHQMIRFRTRYFERYDYEDNKLKRSTTP